MALEERVVLGEAGERGYGVPPDRGRELLGERDGVVEGTGPFHAGPRNDGGVSRPREGARKTCQRFRVRGRAVDHVVVGWRFGFRVPVVHRDRDEDRAPGMLHRGVVGAMELPRHVGGPHGLEAPLDVGSGQIDELPGEEWLEGPVAPVLLAGGDQ